MTVRAGLAAVLRFGNALRVDPYLRQCRGKHTETTDTVRSGIRFDWSRAFNVSVFFRVENRSNLSMITGMIMGASINGMTVREAAEALSVSGRRVLQLIETGIIRGMQINPRMWIVDRADVQRYASTERKPGRPPVKNS